MKMKLKKILAIMMAADGFVQAGCKGPCRYGTEKGM